LLLRRENVAAWLALVGGALYIIHPINVMNGIKLIHLGYLLGGMLCLLALYLYSRYRDQTRSLGSYILEGSIVALMLFSYELYVVSPLLLILYEFFIQARARLSYVSRSALLRSALLWSTLMIVYLGIRWIVFRGVGGYADAWESNPLAPILRGGKWLSGWGFLHLFGESLGFKDALLGLAIGAVGWMLVLRPVGRRLILLAAGWFIVAALPYFAITATEHYVFAFGVIGLVFMLCLGLDELLRSSKGRLQSYLFPSAAALLIMTWIYARAATASHIVGKMQDDSIPAQALSDRMGHSHEDAMVFLATNVSDLHVPLRLELLQYPARMTLREILPPVSADFERALILEDFASVGIKVYALREDRQIRFYSNLSELLVAANNLPPAQDRMGSRDERRRKP
jgi:hypothetical protein